MKTPLTSPCPCGLEKTFGQCCAPYLQKKETPPTAEALLRARYCAFGQGEIDYILETHHSKTKKSVSRDEIAAWANNSVWHGLSIAQSEAGTAKDTQGTIIFCAKFEEKTGENAGKIQEHWEKSFFEREPATAKGAWRFLDAQGVHIGTYKRTEPKVGRNDPCPCGSGKKFKKCHAGGADAEA